MRKIIDFPGKVVMMTPELAKELLSTMTGNRNLRKNVFLKYKADMSEGRWECNWEPIHRVNGKLVNGQHRLNALMAAGVTLPMLIVDVDSVHHVDEAAKRGPYDFVDIANGPDVAAAAVWVLRYEATEPGCRLTSHADVATRSSLVQERMLEDNLLSMSVAYCKLDAFSGWLPRSIAAFVHYMGGKSSPDRIDAFILDVATGAGLKKGTGPYTLRASLLSPRSQKARPARDVICALTTKAWLQYEADAKCAVLRYNATEPFPRFKTPSDGGDAR